MSKTKIYKPHKSAGSALLLTVRLASGAVRELSERSTKGLVIVGESHGI